MALANATEAVMVYFFARLMTAFFRSIPGWAVMPIGRALGRAAYSIDHRHRKVALKNLRRVLGSSKSQSKIEDIAKKVFQHLGTNFVEFCRIPLLNQHNFHNLVRVEGLEHFKEAQGYGKGVILIAGHFGNWELGNAVAPLVGIPITSIYRPMDHEGLDRLVIEIRQCTGAKLVPKHGSTFKVVSRLKHGETVAIIIDQAPRRGGAYVNFLGIPALTTTVPAALARSTGSAVLPAFVVRQENGTHRMILGPQIELAVTDDEERDVMTNTTRFNQILGEYVLNYPEQWFWVHRRWKRRENIAPSVESIEELP